MRNIRFAIVCFVIVDFQLMIAYRCAQIEQEQENAIVTLCEELENFDDAELQIPMKLSETKCLQPGETARIGSLELKST